MVKQQEYKGDRMERVVWWIITAVALVVLIVAYNLMFKQSLPPLP